MQENNITKQISFIDLEAALNAIYHYKKDGEEYRLLQNIDLIRLAQNVDNSIKSYTEYGLGADFVENSHSPMRMAIFLLNYYGEHYLNGATLEIIADDPVNITNKHNNTYKLVLKDLESHTVLSAGNPDAKDKPYDFNTEFIKQLTCYPNNSVNTTKHAWDSFNKGYTEPHRTLDFKSALWTSGKHSHNVDYIIKLTSEGNVELLLNKDLTEKKFNIDVPKANEIFYTKYFRLLNALDTLEGLTWEQIIKEAEELNYVK